MRRLRLDLMVVVATLLTLVMMVVYVGIMRQQSDQPVAWFLAALTTGAVAAGYGANTGFPHRAAALLIAGLVLAVVGALAILSIGLPVLVAGTLCLTAAARSRHLDPAAP